MHIDRRRFVQGALAASCALAPPLRAEGPKSSGVYIGDMHSHLFFFGMGASPEQRPLGPTMAAGNATLVAWSLVGDVPWLSITGKGIKQKGSPKKGEPGKWFEDDVGRIKEHLAAQNLKLVLTVEGATFVEDGIAPLAHAYEQGVRSVQLVHYIDNPLGDFQTEPPQHDGLTDLGREVIAECNRLGILVDLAHCTDKAVRQALDVAAQPVIWSHSSVTRTRTPNWKMPVWQARQLTYDTAKLIADKGGVVGVWPMRSDVGATPESYAARVWELGEWLGDEHVAFGTDMNAVSRPAIASYADLQKVVRFWQKAGFPAASIEKIAIGNFARVLKQAMSARQA